MKEMDSKVVLENKKQSRITLTVDFADKINLAVGDLGDEVALKDLYMSTHSFPNQKCGEGWFNFVSSLPSVEKGALTRALSKIAYHLIDNNYLTLGKLRDKSLEEIAGSAMKQASPAFLKYAFRRGAI